MAYAAKAQPAQSAGQLTAPMVHDVTIVSTKKKAQARVLGIPPEEFGIERGARDIQSCNYCFHEIVTKTRAQLIDEGFDEDQVNALVEYTGQTEIETLARDSVGEHFYTVNGGVNKSADLVRVTEHYVRMDYKGDGRPCLYQVVTGGEYGDILKKDGKDAITEFDAIPIAAATPVPITHRFFGRSMADLVMPLQREKTALKRGALDNMYLANNPRAIVNENIAGVNTLDDLLVSRPGGIVRTKGEGAVEFATFPNITGDIFPMMQYLDAELESRTGLSKQTQGIDANALQNQSATAVAQVFSASQMRLKLIARILGEGVKDIFSLLHATIRKHGQQAQTVRLRNQWVNVDPRDWKTRDDMTINVGLGSGGKAQQFAQMMAIANVQKEMLEGGKANLVDDDKLFNTASELTKIMGYKNPDRFFNDPSAVDPHTGQLLHPPPPPQPDPKVMAVQAKIQGDQQKGQQDAALAQLQAQIDAMHQKMKAEADIEVQRIKAETQAQLAILNAHLKASQQHQDMRHAEHQHRMDAASKVLDMAATAQAHDAKMEQMKSAPPKKSND